MYFQLNLRLKRRRHKLSYEIGCQSSDQCEDLSSPSSKQRQLPSTHNQEQEQQSTERVEFVAHLKQETETMHLLDEAKTLTTSGNSRLRERLAMLTKFRPNQTIPNDDILLPANNEQTNNIDAALLATGSHATCPTGKSSESVEPSILPDQMLVRPPSLLSGMTQNCAPFVTATPYHRLQPYKRQFTSQGGALLSSQTTHSLQSVSQTAGETVCLCKPLSLVKCNRCLRRLSMEMFAAVSNPMTISGKSDETEIAEESGSADNTFTEAESGADSTIIEGDGKDENHVRAGKNCESKKRVVARHLTAAQVIANCSVEGAYLGV